MTFRGTLGAKRGQNALAQEGIEVGQVGPITAALRWKGSADLDLYLMDPSGSLVASSSNGLGSEQLRYQAPARGHYTLMMAAVSARGRFSLTVTYPL